MQEKTNLELIKEAIVDGLGYRYLKYELKCRDNTELCGIIAHTPGHYKRKDLGEDCESHWRNILAGAAVYLGDNSIHVECYKGYCELLLDFNFATEHDIAAKEMGLVIDGVASSIDRFFSFCFGDYEATYFCGDQSTDVMMDELKDAVKANMRAEKENDNNEGLPY